MSSRLRPTIAVHRGEALVTTVADRLDYFGRAVHLALQLPRRAEPGELILTDAVTTDPKVAALIKQSGLPSHFVPVEGPGTSEALAQRVVLATG